MTCTACNQFMFNTHTECRQKWRAMNMFPRYRRAGTPTCNQCYKKMSANVVRERKVRADANYLAGAARKNALAKLKQCVDLKVLQLALELAEGERKELIEKHKRKVECLTRPQT